MKAAKMFSFLLLCFALACTAATNSADQRKAGDSGTKSPSPGDRSPGDRSPGEASKDEAIADKTPARLPKAQSGPTFASTRAFIEKEIQTYLPLIGTKDEPADKLLKAKVIALIPALESLNEFGDDLPAYIEHVRGLLGRESNPAAIDSLQGVLKHLGAGSGDHQNSQGAGSQNKATQSEAFNTATFPFSPQGSGQQGSQKKATERAAEKTDASTQAPAKKNNTATFPF